MDNERACFIAMLAAILATRDATGIGTSDAQSLVVEATRIYDAAHQAHPEADTGIR